jgi:tetratricopeptide (TPR) repeat protein
MPVQGNLKELSIVDFLQILYMNRKSGIMEIKGNGNNFRVFIKNGNIKFIEETGKNILFEEIKKTGILKEEMIKVFEKVQGEDKILEKILKEPLNKEIIKKIIINLINERMFYLMQMKEGSFIFNEIGEEKIPETELEISTQDIILESSRKIDEWMSITSKIPDFSYVLLLSDEWTKKENFKLELDAAEWKILSLVDGKRNISEIISISKENPLRIARKICDLIEKGILKVKEVKAFEEEIKKKRAEEFFIKAREFAKNGNYLEAETFLLRAISLAPDFLMAHLALGDIYYVQKQYRLATQAYYEVIRRDPENPLGYYNLGFVRIKLGDILGALEIIEKGLKNATGKMKEEMENLVKILRKLIIATDSKRSIF